VKKITADKETRHGEFEDPHTTEKHVAAATAIAKDELLFPILPQ